MPLAKTKRSLVILIQKVTLYVTRYNGWSARKNRGRVHLSNSTPSVSSLLSKLDDLHAFRSSRNRALLARTTRIDPRGYRYLGERIFHETSSFYFRAARRPYSVSCAEFNHCAATIDLSRDTIEGGENGNYARGYICFSPSFTSSINLLNFSLSWLGGSSNDPSTMMYESYTFFVYDIRDVTLD